ncbi:MAG: hypothetical protein AAB571_10620 [Chloroflexota bacterium]
MPNQNPEERAGLALLFIGGVSLYVFLLYVWAGNAPNVIAFFSILVTLLIGWGIRARFAPPKPPPPPPRAGFTKRIAERFKRKPPPAAPPPATAAAPRPGQPSAGATPPPKKGLFGGLFKPKEPQKK